jgi:hypothetical protein
VALTGVEVAVGGGWRRGRRHDMAPKDDLRWNSKEEARSSGGNHGEATSHSMSSTRKQVEERNRR